MNASFDVDYATAHYIVIKVALVEQHLPIKAQIVRLLGPRKWQEARERGAQRTLLVREHHRLPMNVSFDVDYATAQIIVIKAVLFEHPLLFAVTLLVFLATTTRTHIVTTNAFFSTNWLLHIVFTATAS